MANKKTILNKEVSRRGFITVLSGLALSLGFGSFINFFDSNSKTNSKTSVSKGYGSNGYGS
jgi:hypothetical protein